MSETKSDARLPCWVWLTLGFLAVLTYTVGLSFPLVGPDEPRYAQVAREMMERGDWITPTLGGHTWFEKPALLYWLEIVSYRIFGVNEAAARFGPALCGLGTILALYVIGRTLQSERGCGIGGYFAIVGASTLGLIAFAHGASFDIVVTFPIAASLAAFWCYERGQRPVLSLILFYIFMGVALLAKGLIGIVFPFGIIGLYYILARRPPSGRFLLSLLWGTIIATIVASVWYVPMYMRHGWQFIEEFIIQHHFQRFTSNKYQHPQSFYFYLWVLPLMTLPWLPFFLGGASKAAKQAFRNRHTQRDAGSLSLFALSWVLVPLAFFSVSGSKLPGYILPAVPGAVILAALLAHDLAVRSRRWKIGIVSTGALTLGVSLVLVLAVVPKFAADDSVKPLIEAADSRGYQSSSVLMLHTVSHNAEFYAAGRLERDEKGQLVEHFGSGEITEHLRSGGGGPMLVLVPNEYASQLTSSPDFQSTQIASNKDLTITAVALH